jgi:hypothetical protein
VWIGSYSDVLPYVREAWNAVLEEFTATIADAERDELVTLVRYLSELAPRHRGHPLNSVGNVPRYGLQRFVSRFDVLARQAEVELIRKLRDKQP